ncbi:shikimate dehydrogenase [Caldifermentibacillus hisashii]|jgi:shikimate dehydrogenase|uniref:shikimate dehydrogenase n=1 Tax=Caldifermentibacillus hisashii TaxID=996558 RepID=UPI0031FD2A98
MSDLARINGETRLIGLFAKPVSHSKSPIIQNAGFRNKNLNYSFLCFEVDTHTLEEAVKAAKVLNLQGLSISMPNKIKIMDYLDEISPEAKMAGAVNTVLNDNGKLIGFNTDGHGYVNSLIEEGVQVEGKKFTILGAGGAGTAIAMQLALEGASEISIFNRNDEFLKVAEKNAELINNETKCKANAYLLEEPERLKKEIESSYCLANATSVGMKELKDLSPIPDSSWLRKDLIVTDAIYNPDKTKLLTQAEEVGCKTINGLGMLLWQGARQFEIWTGEEMPIEYVKEQVFAFA